MLSKIKQLILRLLPSHVAGRLRALRVRHIINTFSPRVVEHAYGAGPLRVWLADPLGAGWYDHDWPELPEITALRKHRLREKARVFDLGAHHGVVAAMLAREVGTSGQVIAVEASAHNAAAAIRNRDINGLRQIKVINAAISDKVGVLIFNEGLNGQIDDGSGASGSVQVDAITIDVLAARVGVPDVVFLDIEGAECLALAGASRVLSSNADWFVEVHVGCGLEKLGGTVDRILACFPADRFTILARAENDAEFRPLTADDRLCQDRFFLLAIRRDGQESPA